MPGYEAGILRRLDLVPRSPHEILPFVHLFLYFPLLFRVYRENGLSGETKIEPDRWLIPDRYSVTNYKDMTGQLQSYKHVTACITIS